MIAWYLIEISLIFDVHVALFLHRHLEADSNMNAVITNGRVCFSRP